MTTGQTSQVAVHDEPIKQVKWIDAPGGGLLATGSWDKTIKYWDLRSPTAVASVVLPERLYSQSPFQSTPNRSLTSLYWCIAMDVAYPLLVVGTADRHIQIFNLTQPSKAYKTILSPLRFQTRVITCFPDASGYAIGSIEGRVAIQHVDDKLVSSNFSFKVSFAPLSPPISFLTVLYDAVSSKGRRTVESRIQSRLRC